MDGTPIAIIRRWGNVRVCVGAERRQGKGGRVGCAMTPWAGMFGRGRRLPCPRCGGTAGYWIPCDRCGGCAECHAMRGGRCPESGRRG